MEEKLAGDLCKTRATPANQTVVIDRFPSLHRLGILKAMPVLDCSLIRPEVEYLWLYSFRGRGSCNTSGLIACIANGGLSKSPGCFSAALPGSQRSSVEIVCLQICLSGQDWEFSRCFIPGDASSDGGVDQHLQAA